MAADTLIEWARHPVTGKGATWQIVTGCSVVSPGCTNCYAMKLAGTRLKHHESRKGLTRDTKAGPVWNGETRFNEQWLTQPLGWKTGRGIFVAAHGDLFAEGVTDAQLDRIFAVMALTPQHIYFVLTKRPERMREYLTRPAGGGRQDIRNHLAWEVLPQVMNQWAPDWKSEGIDGPHRARGIAAFTTWPLPNVWLGVSVEDQPRADERIPILLDTPAAIRFISAEPLLGPIDLEAAWHGETAIGAECWGECAWCEQGHPPLHNCQRGKGDWEKGSSGLDWVIAGGESGNAARPSHPDWFRQLRDQCATADVAFFFKQWGSWHEAATDWREPDGSHHEVDPESHEAEEMYDTRTDKLIALDGCLFTPVTLPPETPARLIERIGKKAAGRTLDGVTHDAFPQPISPLEGEMPGRAEGGEAT